VFLWILNLEVMRAGSRRTLEFFGSLLPKSTRIGKTKTKNAARDLTSLGAALFDAHFNFSHI